VALIAELQQSCKRWAPDRLPRWSVVGGLKQAPWLGGRSCDGTEHQPCVGDTKLIATEPRSTHPRRMCSRQVCPTSVEASVTVVKSAPPGNLHRLRLSAVGLLIRDPLLNAAGPAGDIAVERRDRRGGQGGHGIPLRSCVLRSQSRSVKIWPVPEAKTSRGRLRSRFQDCL